MHNLKYSIARNSQHYIIVSVWQDKPTDSAWNYKMMVDGKVLDEGIVDE